VRPAWQADLPWSLLVRVRKPLLPPQTGCGAYYPLVRAIWSPSPELQHSHDEHILEVTLLDHLALPHLASPPKPEHISVSKDGLAHAYLPSIRRIISGSLNSIQGRCGIPAGLVNHFSVIFHVKNMQRQVLWEVIVQS